MRHAPGNTTDRPAAAGAASGWRALGHTFALECPDTELRSSFERSFANLAGVATAPVSRVERSDDGWSLHAPGGEVLHGDLDDVVDGLLAQVRAGAVRSVDGDAAIVHAAAVAVGTRTVLLPGPSGAGKSSIAVALARRHGWTFLGDEIVGLRRGGRVLPCPLPPRLGRRTRELLDDSPSGAGKRYVDLPTGPVPSTTPATHVVFPRFDPTGGTTLRPLPAATAAARVAAAMFPVPPATGMQLVGDVVAGTQAYDLSFGDLFRAADLVAAAVG